VFAASSSVQSLNGKVSVLDAAASNVVVFAGAGGNVLVDSGPESASRDLLAGLKSLTGTEQVHTLFNTHYHADQTGGNAALRGSDTRIVAQYRTKDWMDTPFWIPSELKYSTPRTSEALPTDTFLDSGSLAFDDEQIDYGYMAEAHTSGDIYVKFNSANVLVVGDVVSPMLDPSFDWYTGAWIGSRVEAMDLLLSLSDDNTAIVPAYGPVLTKAHLQAERDMMSFIYDKTTDLVRQGFGPQEMLDDGFMNSLPRTLDEPYVFLYDLCKGLWAHHNKINHNIV
jgi:glyoxylase-like metal-dependent hydrolase (beta-lactamase superfamily II)